MKTIELTLRAQADIDDLLAHSEARFGPRTADRYRLLIQAGLESLLEDPGRPGVRRAEQPPGLHLYALRHCRRRVPPNDRISRPRHVLAFRVNGEVLLIVRVLDERSDIPARLRDTNNP